MEAYFLNIFDNFILFFAYYLFARFLRSTNVRKLNTNNKMEIYQDISGISVANMCLGESFCELVFSTRYSRYKHKKIDIFY